MIDDLLLQINKPGRYIGGEWNVSKKDFTACDVRFALCFPDLYEVGMSNIGMRILYGVLNGVPQVCCERFFAVAGDLEALLRQRSMGPFSLESGRQMGEFDLIGFSLGSELNYTNVLRMLGSSNIPILARERDNRYPLVIGGGPCALNPEPMHEFFDLFLIGEAEEAALELTDVWRRHKHDYKSGKTDKTEFLSELSRIEGVYAPSLYEVDYDRKGGISHFGPRFEGVAKSIKKRIVKNLNDSFYPVDWLVPYIQIIHDRLNIEIARGCPNRCRFCQARSQYYPHRVRSAEKVEELFDRAYSATGYEEIALCGLSVTDYPRIRVLLERLLAKSVENCTALSLPSIKARALAGELAGIIAKIKKTGLTFAPEAGTERLREVLAKDFSEAEFFQALESSYLAGYQHIKLYFMLGLPHEETTDLDGIAEFSTRVSQLRRKLGMGPAKVNLSVNAFIPKPHTAFAWSGMHTLEEIIAKQSYLGSVIKDRRLNVNFHDARMSFVEGILSRGDRRMSRVIGNAYAKGACFDAWSNYFSYDLWRAAFDEAGIDPQDYLRPHELGDILPWDHIDTGFDRKTLEDEFKKAMAARDL